MKSILNLFRPSPIQSSASISHPGHGDPVFGKVALWIQSGKWVELEDCFESLSLERQGLLLRSIFVSFKVTTNIAERWRSYAPTGAFQRCFRFVSLCSQASDARGAGLAENTDAKQFEGYSHYSQKAYDAIREVLDQDPQNIHALTWAIQANFADIMEWDTLLSYYHESKKIDPSFFPITERMLGYLTPKWFGSERDILDFVEYETKDLPSGSVFWGLIPAAYFHIWEIDVLFERNLSRNVLIEARERIEHAYSMSIGSSEYKGSHYDFYLYNFFAFCFREYKDKNRTAKLIEGMGRVMTAHPWYSCYNLENIKQARRSLNDLRASYELAPLSGKEYAS